VTFHLGGVPIQQFDTPTGDSYSVIQRLSSASTDYHSPQFSGIQP